MDKAIELGLKTAAMIFLAAYVFLLRMPSECLPITVCGEGFDDDRLQSRIHAHEGELVLVLKSRKNKPGGSVLKRTCLCAQCPRACPIHVLAAYFSALRLRTSAGSCERI